MDLVHRFITLRAVEVIQFFGRSLLETIPEGEILRVERPLRNPQIVEVVWKEKPYLVLRRDLIECTKPALARQVRCRTY